MDKKKVHEVLRLCDELKKRAEKWEYAAYHDWRGILETMKYGPPRSQALFDGSAWNSPAPCQK